MPYYDYGGFGESYFEGRHHASPNDAGYSDYHRGLLPFDHYAQKIHDELTSQGFDPTGQKILVVGCAYGYTVEYLVDNYGIEAFGMDVSQWAVDQAASEIAYPNRIFQGDVLNSNDLKSVRQGASANGPFRVILNECVIECLTDTEAQTAVSNMRSEAQTQLVHRTWSSGGSDVNPTYYNAKSISEWQSLVDSSGQDMWFTEQEFQP